jgi:hypothetical protein
VQTPFQSSDHNSLQRFSGHVVVSMRSKLLGFAAQEACALTSPARQRHSLILTTALHEAISTVVCTSLHISRTCPFNLLKELLQPLINFIPTLNLDPMALCLDRLEPNILRKWRHTTLHEPGQAGGARCGVDREDGALDLRIQRAGLDGSFLIGLVEVAHEGTVPIRRAAVAAGREDLVVCCGLGFGDET